MQIYSSQMAKDAFKLSTMVGENFKIYLSLMAKNAFKLSTMVGEKIEIYLSQMAKNHGVLHYRPTRRVTAVFDWGVKDFSF